MRLSGKITETHLPMKIGYHCPAWPPQVAFNGIATYLNYQLQGLKSLGYRPIIITPNLLKSDSDRNTVFALEPNSRKNTFYERLFDRYLYHRNKTLYIARDFSERTRRVFEKNNLNLDIYEVDESFGAYNELKKRLNTRLVLRIHGPWFLVGKGYQYKRKEFIQRIRNEGKGITNETPITSPSNHTLNSLRDFYNKDFTNAIVIPNPIAPASSDELWNPVTENEPYILFVGRFDTVKGGDIAIDVFREIALKNKQIKLYFVGPDIGLEKNGLHYKLREYIRQQIPEYHIRNRIIYHGKLDYKSVKKLRKQALITIITSRYESFSYSLIEALSQGCPVVATSVGGIPEIINHHENGLLVDLTSKDAIAGSILELLDNDSMLRQMSANAIDSCTQKYHPKKIAKMTINFYSQQI